MKNHFIHSDMKINEEFGTPSLNYAIADFHSSPITVINICLQFHGAKNKTHFWLGSFNQNWDWFG